MSNILAYIVSASHEITKAIDLSPRLVMTRHGMDDTDPLRLGYFAGTTRHYNVCALHPCGNCVRLKFGRRDYRNGPQLPLDFAVEMNFGRKNSVKLIGLRRKDVPAEILAFASDFTAADHYLERLDFQTKAAELEEYIGRHFKAMLRRTRKIPAIERKLAKLRTAAAQVA